MREAFAVQKLLTLFNKNIGLFQILIFEIFIETLTNDVVSFEQPGPGMCSHLASASFSSLDSNIKVSFVQNVVFSYFIYLPCTFGCRKQKQRFCHSITFLKKYVLVFISFSFA